MLEKYNAYCNKAQIKKACAVLLAVMIAMVITYFVAYEAAYEIHDCTGADCPICMELHIAESMTKQIGTGILFAAAIFLPVLLTIKVMNTVFCFVQKRTLIYDKVRMDD